MSDHSKKSLSLIPEGVNREEWIQKAARRMRAQHDKEIHDATTFLASEDAVRLLDIFKAHAANDKNAPSFSEDELDTFAQSVFRLHRSEAKAEPDSEFPTSYIEYEGLQVGVTIGQGSFYHFKL